MSNSPSAPMDRGDSHDVGALGTCMLHHGATGLGALQKPLRDMYTTWRQSSAPPPKLQACQLVVSASGVCVTPRGGQGGIEQQYALANILLWDAVQFVVVRGSDKKKRTCAFEPLDNDHSRNKDNLFASLDKKFHYLQPLSHPGLFTCVIRRTAGIKALDVHVFVCGSCDEALELVRSLSKVQTVYSSQQAVERGVFGYKPFQQPLQLRPSVTATRHSSATSETTAPAAATAATATAAAAAKVAKETVPVAPPPQSSSSRRPVGLALSASSQGSRPVCVLTQDYFSGSQLNLASAANDTDRVRSGNSKSTKTPGGAEDINKKSGAASSDNSGQSGSGSGRTGSLPTSRHDTSQASSGTESLSRAAGGTTTPSADSRTSSLTSARSLASVLCSPPPSDSGFHSSATDTADSRGSGNKKKSKKEKKEKKSKKAAIVKPLPQSPDSVAPPKQIVPQKGKNLVKVLPTDTLGEGYSLLSGSGGNLPGYNPPRPQPPQSVHSHYAREPSPEYYRRTPHKEPDLDYDYDVDIGLFEQPAQSVSSRTRAASPGSSHRSSASAHYPRHQLRPPKSPGYLDRPPVMPARTRPPQQQQQPHPAHHEDSPMPVLRPIAMVTPHKVLTSSGGVRVLPSQHHSGKAYSDYDPTPLRSKYEGNWHFRHAEDEEYESKSEYWSPPSHDKPHAPGPAASVHQPHPSAPRQAASSPPHEGELLLNQKKDAEIAAVMQNLHFELHEHRTLTPGAPGGMNFERSLGYFP